MFFFVLFFSEHQLKVIEKALLEQLVMQIKLHSKSFISDLEMMKDELTADPQDSHDLSTYAQKVPHIQDQITLLVHAIAKMHIVLYSCRRTCRIVTSSNQRWVKVLSHQTSSNLSVLILIYADSAETWHCHRLLSCSHMNYKLIINRNIQYINHC